MRTTIHKPSAPQWILVDAEGARLGRLAAKAAHLLMGKHRRSFSPHQVWGDHVVVVNVEKISVLPQKLEKKYRWHTGYIGHLKEITLEQLLVKDPRKAIEWAVFGMLPRNRLRQKMMKQLHTYVGSTHPHEAQKPMTFSFPSHSKR